jgi:peptidyl-prolyl cis-trans isomerase C
MRIRTIMNLVSLLALGLPLATAQTPPSTQPRPTSSPAAAASAPAEVAATVNGHAILAGEVEELVKARTPAEILANPQAAAVIEQQRARYLEMLIDQYSLDQEVAQAGIKIDDAEMVQAMDAELEAYLSSNGLTRAEFEIQLRAQRNISVKDFLTQRVADPSMRANVARRRLIEKKSPASLNVTDAEIEDYYEKYREGRFTKPAQVRASHVLITPAGAAEQDKGAARQKAEQVLAEARQPGADFAALASKYSNCPSKDRGGDLGYFSRQGALDEMLAVAAFALKIGELSNVVETKFGYHVILVTDRKEAAPIPLEQAKLGIQAALRDKKVGSELQRFAAELRGTARIVYPPGKEPAQTSQPTGAATAPAAPPTK